MRHGAAIAAVALLMSSCAARATVPARAVHTPDPHEVLRGDLRALFNAPDVTHAQWGVHFYSLGHEDLLYSLNAGQFMVPASNQKLLTSAAAAERLGWDFQFTTRLLATAPIDSEGRINGNVIVVSDGDPTINPRHPHRWRAFDDWAAALKAKGVRIINGTLVGDDNAFAEPGWGVGWAWDNLQYGYGAPASALQFNENQIEVLIGPGLEPGSPAIIGTAPIGSGLVVDPRVSTVPAGERTFVDIARIPGTAFLIVSGQIAAGSKPLTVLASVDNPTRFYLSALREALGRYGIFVAGGIVDVDDLPVPPQLDNLEELVVDRSAPLGEIIDVTLKWSRNIYAETMLLALDSSGKPATGTRGLDSVRETLGRWGIAAEAYLSRDGSGLSRYDYVSADVLSSLLIYLWTDPRHAAPFQASLPVAGISGSLANRMKGTPAQGRVRAKTGTLSNVRSLAGYVTTLDGDTVVFAIMVNNFRVPTADVDAVMERALNRVVEFRR